MASPRLLRLWPEEKVELVTAPTLFSGRGQIREQSEPPTMVAVFAQDSLVSWPGQDERAESAEVVLHGCAALIRQWLTTANLTDW